VQRTFTPSLPGKLRRAALAFLLLFACATSAQVELWMTDPGGAARFEKQPGLLDFVDHVTTATTIKVNEKTRFQQIDGFGFCLTGGSATHLMGMSPGARGDLLAELFGTEGNNIGSSYLRVTIGASDLNDRVYSYDDLPPGQVDPALKHFSLEADRAEVLPVLHQILKISPGLKLLGSPWSPPAWMKTNHDTVGGSLDAKYYDAYARYFVKYVQSMKAEGIPIDAITVQNEPLHPGNNPSLFMPAVEQAMFIKNHLGPAFQKARTKTKIIIYDHNADHPDYPLTILKDPGANVFVDGSAFHLYRGPIEALGQVHDAFPTKNLYFTEQWVSAPGNLREDLDWHIKTLIIGASRNWSRTVLEWNLSSNPQLTPHTDRGGCDRCLGAVTIDGDRVTRNSAYYIIAHASKFVRPGSVRIDSTQLEMLPNVAFESSVGRKVLIILNASPSVQRFDFDWQGRYCASALPPGAVGTFVW
jgi:glucosylceramidase